MDDPFVLLPESEGFQSEREKCPRDDVLAADHRVILVTGPKHSGKTTLVETLITSLAGKGLHLAGILSRGLWKDNLREGFDLVDLSSGRRTPLARRRSHPHPQHRMMFDFFDSGFRAGLDALSPDACRQADIVVVDELGRLEARGEGWTPPLKALLTLDKPLFILIVRLDGMPQIGDRFGLHGAPVVDVRNARALDQLRAVVGAYLIGVPDGCVRPPSGYPHQMAKNLKT
jgi:nucleoside-triphosphatase THEP1